jgi:hypothetical protein
MTDSQINIAIAEACGWKRGFASANEGKVSGGRCGWIGSDGNWKAEHPDYCNDLNAMHRAELHLSPDEQEDYAESLFQSDSEPDEDWMFHASHSSARQRAEAFLRTKGLWREAVVEGGK